MNKRSRYCRLIPMKGGVMKDLTKKLIIEENFAREMTEDEKRKIYHDNILEYDPMIEEISRRTHFPRFIVRMFYAVESQIMFEVGLMH